jgi:hypothetical protein
MIGRFSDLHGGLGVPDGPVEPAELGEHVGGAGLLAEAVEAPELLWHEDFEGLSA